MKTIQSPVIITSFSSKVDGSMRFSCVTPELSAEEKVAFMELQNLQLDGIFKPTDNKTDTKEIKGEFDSKTPSQRLRNTLFVYWEQSGKQEDFDTFYLRQMEIIIDKVKGYLD